MVIRPYGKREDWKPVELFNRVQYRCKQDPTEENQQQLQELLTQYPDIVAHPVSPKQEERFHSGETTFFFDNDPLTIVLLLRYSATGHTHDFYELIYVYRGSCQHYLKNNCMVVVTGDFCILPPNQLHRIFSYADDDLIINILIRKFTFNQSFQSLLKDYGILSAFVSHTLFQKENSDCLLFRCGEDPVIYELILKMYEEYVSYSPFSHSILVGQLMQFLGEVMRSHHMDTVPLTGNGGSQPTQGSAMFQYMDDYLSTVTLQELARHFSYRAAAAQPVSVTTDIVICAIVLPALLFLYLTALFAKLYPRTKNVLRNKEKPCGSCIDFEQKRRDPI